MATWHHAAQWGLVQVLIHSIPVKLLKAKQGNLITIFKNRTMSNYKDLYDYYLPST